MSAKQSVMILALAAVFIYTTFFISLYSVSYIQWYAARVKEGPAEFPFVSESRLPTLGEGVQFTVLWVWRVLAMIVAPFVPSGCLVGWCMYQYPPRPPVSIADGEVSFAIPAVSLGQVLDVLESMELSDYLKNRVVELRRIQYGPSFTTARYSPLDIIERMEATYSRPRVCKSDVETPLL